MASHPYEGIIRPIFEAWNLQWSKKEQLNWWSTPLDFHSENDSPKMRLQGVIPQGMTQNPLNRGANPQLQMSVLPLPNGAQEAQITTTVVLIPVTKNPVYGLLPFPNTDGTIYSHWSIHEKYVPQYIEGLVPLLDDTKVSPDHMPKMKSWSEEDKEEDVHSEKGYQGKEPVGEAGRSQPWGTQGTALQAIEERI